MWNVLLTFSFCVLLSILVSNAYFLFTCAFLAPLIGWLADVKIGRYKVIKIGSIVSFLPSILYYFAIFTGKSDSTLSTVFLSLSYLILFTGMSCYSAAMLPFLTDQIIGATSDELSAVVR